MDRRYARKAAKDHARKYARKVSRNYPRMFEKKYLLSSEKICKKDRKGLQKKVW